MGKNKGLYYHTFDLSYYFDESRSMITFFDCYFKDNLIKKEPLLNELNIAPTSYRKSRRMNQRIGLSFANTLNKEFGFNNLDKSKMDKYEQLLSRVFSDVYLKVPFDDEIVKSEIQECIDDNNCLKPIFLLFYAFLLTNDSNKSSQIMKNEILELMPSIKGYTKFFTDEIKQIYFLVKLFVCKFSDFNITKEMELCNDMTFTKGLGLYYLSTKNFMGGKYELGMIFAIECEKILEKDCNYQRLVAIRNNIAAFYNVLNLYYFALEYEQKQLILVSTNNQFEKFRISLINNYLTTLFMLKRFSDIRDFLIENPSTVSICRMYNALSLFMLGDREKAHEICSAAEPTNEITTTMYLLDLKIIDGREFSAQYRRLYPKMTTKMKDIFRIINKKCR